MVGLLIKRISEKPYLILRLQALQLGQWLCFKKRMGVLVNFPPSDKIENLFFHKCMCKEGNVKITDI